MLLMSHAAPVCAALMHSNFSVVMNLHRKCLCYFPPLMFPQRGKVLARNHHLDVWSGNRYGDPGRCCRVPVSPPPPHHIHAPSHISFNRSSKFGLPPPNTYTTHIPQLTWFWHSLLWGADE